MGALELYRMICSSASVSSDALSSAPGTVEACDVLHLTPACHAWLQPLGLLLAACAALYVAPVAWPVGGQVNAAGVQLLVVPLQVFGCTQTQGSI